MVRGKRNGSTYPPWNEHIPYIPWSLERAPFDKRIILKPSIFTGEHAVSFRDDTYDTYFCLQYTGDIIEICGFKIQYPIWMKNFFDILLLRHSGELSHISPSEPWLLIAKPGMILQHDSWHSHRGRTQLSPAALTCLKASQHKPWWWTHFIIFVFSPWKFNSPRK